MNKPTISVLVACAVAALVAGCSVMPPLGPTVQVSPGPNKSFDDFAQDQTNCKQYASDQVRPQVMQANANAISAGTAGTPDAVTQAAMQKNYDDAYSQCMTSNGEAVAGAAPAAAPAADESQPAAAPAAQPTGPKYDRTLVSNIQTELVRIGLLSGQPDGKFGPRTQGAISDYQKTRSLPVDGKPTQALLDDLRQH